jgi:hypothetical protein
MDRCYDVSVQRTTVERAAGAASPRPASRRGTFSCAFRRPAGRSRRCGGRTVKRRPGPLGGFSQLDHRHQRRPRKRGGDTVGRREDPSEGAGRPMYLKAGACVWRSEELSIDSAFRHTKQRLEMIFVLIYFSFKCVKLKRKHCHWKCSCTEVQHHAAHPAFSSLSVRGPSRGRPWRGGTLQPAQPLSAAPTRRGTVPRVPGNLPPRARPPPPRFWW